MGSSHSGNHLRVTTREVNKTLVETVSSVITYEGRAVSMGSLTSAPVWQICRITTAGDTTTTEYADEGNYSQIWDDRATLFVDPDFFNDYSTQFDGINDLVSFGNNFNYDNANQWSFSIWLKPDNTAVQRAIYSKVTNDANVFGWGFYHTALGTILVQMRALAQLQSYTGLLSLTAGVWNHLVITYSGNQNINGVRVYINGVVDTTPVSGAVTNTLLTTQPAVLGTRNSGFFYSGKMDEMTIWSKSLSASEVTSLYNSGSPQDPSAESFASDLANYYRMGDDDAYPVIFDNAGSVNGLMTNMPSTAFVLDAP